MEGFALEGSALPADELGEYLNGLSDSFADSLAVNDTGSEIADAIISEKRVIAEKIGYSTRL